MMFSGCVQSVINPFLPSENVSLFPGGVKGSPSLSASSQNICKKRLTC
jgi:hypothetical protein